MKIYVPEIHEMHKSMFQEDEKTKSISLDHRASVNKHAQQFESCKKLK